VGDVKFLCEQWGLMTDSARHLLPGVHVPWFFIFSAVVARWLCVLYAQPGLLTGIAGSSEIFSHMTRIPQCVAFASPLLSGLHVSWLCIFLCGQCGMSECSLRAAGIAHRYRQVFHIVSSMTHIPRCLASKFEQILPAIFFNDCMLHVF